MVSFDKILLVSIVLGTACISRAAEFIPLTHLYETPKAVSIVAPVSDEMQFLPTLIGDNHLLNTDTQQKLYHLFNVPSIDEFFLALIPSAQFLMTATTTSNNTLLAKNIPTDAALIQQINQLQQEISSDISRLNATHIEINKLRIQSLLAQTKSVTANNTPASPHNKPVSVLASAH